MRTNAFFRLTAFWVVAAASWTAHAGGPRFVAGETYFDPAMAGHPVIWAGGVVSYYLDQGALSTAVSHESAAATVSAAAAVWNAVPTAAVLIKQGGNLNENVSGQNVSATASGISMPVDIQSSATNTPVAVVFDEDGSVIDAFYGTGASNPDDCVDSGVIARVDNLASSGFIAHAVLLVNGLCTGSADQLKQIEFQLIRAFGRVLGLDWSQANDAVLFGPGLPSLQQLEGWPLMRPVDINCDQLSVDCVPEPLQLRTDDVAAISRLYQVTPANAAAFPGKLVTASATIAIRGSIHFQRGQGMQGVNVIARPMIPGVGLPDDRYPTASVSGFLFSGDHGNPVTGFDDTSGNPLAQFGSTDETVEGYYELDGIMLPPGENQADFLLTLEPVNALYTGNDSVGPYILGSPTPSGTMPTQLLHGLTAGSVTEQDFTIADSASDLGPGSGDTLSSSAIPVPGEWTSRIANLGQSSWFSFPVLGGRHFTIEAQALDEDSSAISDEADGANLTENKLRPVLGIWNGSDDSTNPPVNASVAPFNGAAVGVTALGVDAIADGQLLLGVADQRGDGRPDYVFHGRLLYADQVMPQHLGLNGGTVSIAGSGFHDGMLVTMQGGSLASPVQGTILSVMPTLLVAMMPPAIAPSGSLDLVITDPSTNGIAAIASGISYGVGSADSMTLVTAPPANVGVNVPATFTVRVLGPDQVTPVGGVPVTFSIASGSATYNGANTTSTLTTGDGLAMATAVANEEGATRLQASLTNGNVLSVEFRATATPSIAALSSQLFLAPGALWTWTPAVQVWTGGSPASGAVITWIGSGVQTTSTSSSANLQGVAATSLSLGPWPAGSSLTLTACTVSDTCVSIPVYTVHTQAEILSAVSGTSQMLSITQAPDGVVTRLLTPAGQPIVGGTVQYAGVIRAWTSPCPSPGPCDQGRLLSSFLISATSGADGSTAFMPPLATSAQRIIGIASTEDSGAVPFEIEISP